jgi:hypothetical protein
MGGVQTEDSACFILFLLEGQTVSSVDTVLMVRKGFTTGPVLFLWLVQTVLLFPVHTAVMYFR